MRIAHFKQFHEVPQQAPQAAAGGETPPPSLRHLLAEIAELVLLCLDELDGDENLEEGGDAEPGTWPNDAAARGVDTPETADENLEDGADDEPSLGWTLSGNYGDVRASDEERELDDADHDLDVGL